MTVVRGVDGCRAGWISVSLALEDGDVTARVFPSAAALFDDGPAVVTAIDIPIGLQAKGARACDEEARRLLARRASSVFPAPVRAALTAETYESACAASTAACGKKLSKQTFGILPKIRDVDLVMQVSPSGRSTFEVHPEVSFCFWNDRLAMKNPKHTGFGFAERLRLVERQFSGFPEKIRSQFDRDDVADDDILDAFAALWTAIRIHAHEAARVTAADERDECGLSMQIWA